MYITEQFLCFVDLANKLKHKKKKAESLLSLQWHCSTDIYKAEQHFNINTLCYSNNFFTSHNLFNINPFLILFTLFFQFLFFDPSLWWQRFKMRKKRNTVSKLFDVVHWTQMMIYQHKNTVT